LQGDTWTSSSEARAHARELGERIRSHRVDAGLEVSDLSAITKIGVGNLRSLESGHLEELPGPVFIKGFIRSICKELRQDPEPLTQLLDLVFTEPEPEETESVNGSNRRVAPLVITGILLVGLIAGGIFLHGKSEDTGKVEAVGKTAPEEVVTPAEPPALRQEDTAAAEKAEKKVVDLDLILRATEKTWLRIQTDASKQWETTMKPGDEIHLKAKERITLFIGNAGGIIFELNGRRFGPLGTQGQVISNYVITRDNL